MFDCVAMGELMVDFTPAGISEEGRQLYERNAGGAPASVSACVARLGKTSAYISKVGRDSMGEFLKSTLEGFKVNTESIKTTNYYPTSMSFVSFDEEGGRSYEYYRGSAADLMVTGSEVNTDIIKTAKVFAFGSDLLANEPSGGATLAAAECASQSGCVVCFDPNLRLGRWKREIEAKDAIARALQFVDVLKLSESELVFLTGEIGIHGGALKLLKDYNLKAVIVTMGEHGAYCLTLSYEITVPAYAISVADTTGAGDAFMGGFIYKLLEYGKDPDKLGIAEMMICLDFANAVGSMTTTRLGAMTGLPQIEEVYECMRNTPKKA